MTRITALVATALLLCAPAAIAQDDVLNLRVGDPERRDKTVALVLDGIVDTRDGAVLTTAEVAQRLSDVDLLFVGESHTAIEFHRAQRHILEALVAAGRDVMIGLEMFPVTEQASLDAWVRGDYAGERAFVEGSRWYEHWGYNWDYYSAIFRLAREHGLPMFAINAPRDVVSAVRRKGIDGLTPEEAAYMPPSIDTDNADHLSLFKAYIGDDGHGGGMTDEQWQSMFAAQCTWDATMGYNAVRALQASEAADPIMVVLIGSGHVSYGLGIERQSHDFFDGTTATLIPVPVADENGHPVRTLAAAYADFVWGVPAEDETLYPSLGLSTTTPESGQGLRVLFAQDGTPSARAGVESGDLLVSIDGVTIVDKEHYSRLVGAKRWGDSVTLGVERGDVSMQVTVPLRRSGS
jgi:uncharacterized iron-regulated protein